MLLISEKPAKSKKNSDEVNKNKFTDQVISTQGSIIPGLESCQLSQSTLIENAVHNADN